MTLIDRVAPATTATAPAETRTQQLRAQLDEITGPLDARLADHADELVPTDLDRLSLAAQAILDAGIDRGTEELGTVRSLPVRRAAWVRARQQQLVVAGLLGHQSDHQRDHQSDHRSDHQGDLRLGRATIASASTERVSPAVLLASWQRHLAVFDAVERGLRHVKTAVGDSPLAPDRELADHERDLHGLARFRPASLDLWDHLFERLSDTGGQVQP